MEDLGICGFIIESIILKGKYIEMRKCVVYLLFLTISLQMSTNKGDRTATDRCVSATGASVVLPSVHNSMGHAIQNSKEPEFYISVISPAGK